MEEGQGAPTTLRTDLALELHREHTLLYVMAARMRETAEWFERGTGFDPARIRRGLEVHRRYLLEVHQPNDERVAKALARSKSAAIRAALAECRAQHPKAQEFQREAEALVREVPAPKSEAARSLARLYREEADRVEKHHAHEEETLYWHLERHLSAAVRHRLLAEVQRVDETRVGAEVALVSWASQLHPAAD